MHYPVWVHGVHKGVQKPTKQCNVAFTDQWKCLDKPVNQLMLYEHTPHNYGITTSLQWFVDIEDP